jgi:protease-4
MMSYKDSEHGNGYNGSDNDRQEQEASGYSSYNSYGSSGYGDGQDSTVSASASASGSARAYQQTYTDPAAYVPRPQKRGMSGWIVLLIVIVICFSLIVMTSSCVSSFSGLAATEQADNSFSPPTDKYLARLSVVGEIGDFDDQYSSSTQSFHYRYTLNTIDSLIEDENNVGLVIYANSPGGGVYESDATYLKVMEYKEKTQRPVYVYMGAMAASGAYYISAAADKIYANRNTWTGSIGVISGTFFDVSEFLSSHGIKATDITSGPNKGMGSYYTPMTKEQKDILQSLVDEAYEQFVSIVAEGRGISIDETKKIADGRIYTAAQAEKNGLIDAVMGEREAYDAFRKEAGDEQLQIWDFSYQAQKRVLDMFGLSTDIAPADAGFSAQSDVSRVLDIAENSNPFELKYLFEG